MTKKIFSVLGMLILTYFLVKSIPILLGENVREESIHSVSMVVILAWLMLVVLPVIWIKYVWKQTTREYGWRLPKMNKKNWITLAVLSALMIGTGVCVSLIGDFQQYYKLQDHSLLYFVFMGLATPLIYFVAEEFIFHGFLFFRLLRQIGAHSYWVVSGLFMLLHVGKPTVEVFVAFFVSLVLCATAHKTKSFLPAVFLHFILATTINILVN